MVDIERRLGDYGRSMDQEYPPIVPGELADRLDTGMGIATVAKVSTRPRRRAVVAAALALGLLALLLVAILPSRSGNDATQIDGAGQQVQYSPWVDVQRILERASDEIVFTATISGDIRPDELSFRLVTMDTFLGEWFFASDQLLAGPETRPWVVEGHAWEGPTALVTVDVAIGDLASVWLPTPTTAVDVVMAGPVIPSVSVRSDAGELSLDDGVTERDLQYLVEAEIPLLDLAVLVSDSSGALTPVFASAAASGESVPPPDAAAIAKEPLPSRERYTTLTGGNTRSISRMRDLAEAVTERADSDFERALALEAWFHTSEAFSYSTDTESSDLRTLSSWLLEPESTAYRTGYAEQFATSMAVLARSLDLPSRVVLGFAPGEETSANSNEVAILASDAHAWVEIWIERAGWISFDPTPRPSADSTPTFEAIGDQLGFDLADYLLAPDGPG